MACKHEGHTTFTYTFHRWWEEDSEAKEKSGIQIVRCRCNGSFVLLGQAMDTIEIMAHDGKL